MKFSVSMEDCRPLLKLLIKYEILTEFRKFHMKDQCVIYFGQIQTREQDGVFLLEEQVTHLDKIFLSNLTEQMISN